MLAKQLEVDMLESVLNAERQVCAQNYSPLPVVLTKAKGVWAWDTEGHKYLDMMSAYSAVSHGHSHPRLVKALQDQAETLCIVSRAFYTDKLGPFLHKLCEVSGLEKALPMNTGAEAVETAIKAARRWGYEKKGIPENEAEILVADNNFHGRTTTIVSFSTSTEARRGFGPYTPGFKKVAFDDLSAVEVAITDKTCAVLIEPIQGEAGIIVPGKGYLKALSALCKKHNVLLLLDEIQSGLGRTGKMFAFQHEGIIPDGLMVGKALGGGVLPVSAFVGKAELLDVFTPGSHGSTFGGNPLSAAVALEALNILEDENLVENSAKLGAYFQEKLLSFESPVIEHVHGLGLWIGVDINQDIISGHDLAMLLLKEGILCKETHEKTIRFAPPLSITKEELDHGLAIIESTLRGL